MPVWADDAPAPLTPDRPGFTNGSDTVVPGRVQVEAGVGVTRAADRDGGAKTTDYPETLIRVGLSPTLELRVATPDYFHVTDGTHGFGDSSLGVKMKVYQSRDGNTKAALTPALSLPTGARDFTSKRVDPLLTLAGQTALGKQASIAANLALSDPTVDGRRIAHVTPSTSLTYQFTPALAGYGELYDDFPREGAPSPLADGGLTYLINPNLQLDLEAGFGLGGGAPKHFVGGGVALRF